MELLPGLGAERPTPPGSTRSSNRRARLAGCTIFACCTHSRASRVIELRLEDSDWERGHLRVRGKSGREQLLPMPADVGAAIDAYLQQGRPTSKDQHLFLRSMAPVRGLMSGSDAIGTIVRYATTLECRRLHKFALALHERNDIAGANARRLTTPQRRRFCSA